MQSLTHQGQTNLIPPSWLFIRNAYLLPPLLPEDLDEQVSHLVSIDSGESKLTH